MPQFSKNLNKLDFVHFQREYDVLCFFKYDLFVYIFKSTKRMNKFDRVSAKLQIYFQTRIFYTTAALGILLGTPSFNL